MVDHRSTSLPECLPAEYPAPEPCLLRISEKIFYINFILEKFTLELGWATMKICFLENYMLGPFPKRYTLLDYKED